MRKIFKFFKRLLGFPIYVKPNFTMSIVDESKLSSNLSSNKEIGLIFAKDNYKNDI